MATAECKVFHGVSAVITKVTSHSKFSVLAMVTDKVPVDLSATERLFEVDLHATPRTVGLKNWSEIKFDDRGVDRFGDELKLQANASLLNCGVTTLGAGATGDLTDGCFVGAVYVEHAHYLSIYESSIALPDIRWPGDRFHRYQITSVAYSRTSDNGARAGQRYHGFLGHVVGVPDDGTTIKVAFPQPNGAPTLGPFSFRLDDPHECDSDPPADALGQGTSITADPTIDATGAFFVALPHAAALGLKTPKMPIGEG